MKTRIVVLLAIVALSVPRTRADALEAAVSRTHADAGLAWGPCPPVFPAGCEIAILHGDPAAPHADAFLRVPAGYTIPPHRHTSPEHMILVAGELEVRYAKEKPFTMRTGTYAYGPAKVPHEARCRGSVACVLYVGFETAVDAEAATLSD